MNERHVALLQSSSVGPALYGERLAVFLGLVTLGLALATFLSCRTCVSLFRRFGVSVSPEAGWYRPFYRYHGYYWSGFLFALFLHMMSAAMHTSIPGSADPDAGIHRLILLSAGGSLVLTGIVLSSCRSLVGLVSLFTTRSPMTGPRYRRFHQYHSYYWLVLVPVIVAHFAFAYSHVGFWPK